MNKSENTLNLFDAVFVFVVVVSFVAVALLSANIYKSSYSLILGTILFLALAKFFNFSIEIKDNRFGIGIVLILFIALLFRFSPYLFAVGGQDPGLYTCMSSHIEQTGTVKVIDSFRENLDDAQKGIYDASNQMNKDVHQPGVYIRDINKSEYVFPWYPLHPVWMAIFAQLFGSDNRAYSLVFFSLISIISFYLLALELSGGRRYPAYLVALLLAVNPLHAFFSKFPTNEIVALAFASSSLYFLLRYYKSALADHNNVVDLVLSAGLMGCLFFVRMNVYIYVVFFYALCLLTLLFEGNAQIRKHLLSYFITVLALFVASNLYYFIFLPELFLGVWGIFVQSQKAMLMTVVTVALLMTLVIFAGSVKKIRSLQMIPSLIPHYKRRVLYLVAGVFAASAMYHIHAFRVILHLHGFQLSSHIPLYWVVLYLSPFGFILCAAAIYYYGKKGDDYFLLLILFVLASFVYYAVMLPSIINGEPYQYYHARFLLSEIIPFSLLIVSLYLDVLRTHRAVSFSFLALMACFSLFFSSYQLTGKEEPDINFYRDITASVKSNDGLLMRAGDAATIIRTPLTYYCNLNLLVIGDFNEFYRDYAGTIKAKYNDLYLLSGELINDGALAYVKTVSFKYGCFANGFHALNFFPAERPKRSFMTHGKSLIPTLYNHGERKYYLYRFTSLSNAAYDDFNRTGRLTIKNYESQLVNFYPDGWTKGAARINNLEYVMKHDDRFLIIDTFGNNPYVDDISKLQLQVYVNQKKLRFNRQKRHSFYFDLDLSVDVIREISIESRAFVPKDLGINDDTRILGVDVASIEIRGDDR